MRVANHSWYLSLCKEHYEKYKETNESFQNLDEQISEVLRNADDPDEPPEEYYTLLYEQLEPKRELEKHALFTILSATMYAEAFIYYYAVSTSKLSANYFKKYLDNLSLLSKWVVTPRLTVGEDFPTDSQAFQHLKKVIEVRNKLVHFKSRDLMGHEEIAKYYDNNYMPFLETAEIAYKMTNEIKDELENLHPEFFNPQV